MIKNILKSIHFVVVSLAVTYYHFALLAIGRLKGVLTGRPFTNYEAHKIAILWGQRYLRAIPGWQVEIRGQENIPPEHTPYVIVANHESATDIMAIYFLGLQFRWLAKESVFKIPGVGSGMHWCGYVPVRRGDKNSATKALEEAAQRLADNVPMLFFPEGTRSTTGHVREFKTGAFRLALDAGVPVLPVVLHGAGKLLKKKTVIPHPATVHIEVLPLVASLPNENANAYTERVKKMIVACHEEMSERAKKEDSYAPKATQSHVYFHA